MKAADTHTHRSEAGFSLDSKLADWPQICAAAHRLIKVRISDEAHELSTQQGAAAHLVGQQMGHGLGEAAMHQDVGVQAAGQQGLTLLQGEAVTSACKTSQACNNGRLCGRCSRMRQRNTFACMQSMHGELGTLVP